MSKALAAVSQGDWVRTRLPFFEGAMRVERVGEVWLMLRTQDNRRVELLREAIGKTHYVMRKR